MADFPISQNSTHEQEQQTSSSNRFFIPLIFSFSSHPRTESTEQDQETNQSIDHIVTISFFNQDMMMMMNPSLKDGPLPASKASIEAMRKIEITEKDQGDGECSICLEGWKIGEEVKEMPCKHSYHSNCIEKWLGIHGSCPVCRFKMPVDEEESKKEERGTSVERELSDEETRFVMHLLGLLRPSNNNNNQEN